MMSASRPLGWTSPPREVHWRYLFIGSCHMAQPAGNTQPSPAKFEASAHSSDSSLREQALGHLFLGQLLAFMWQSGARDIEVLKSEVDRGGDVLVLEANGIIRHVQLKSSFRGSKSPEGDGTTQLPRKPRRCVPLCGIAVSTPPHQPAS